MLFTFWHKTASFFEFWKDSGTIFWKIFLRSSEKVQVQNLKISEILQDLLK